MPDQLLPSNPSAAAAFLGCVTLVCGLLYKLVPMVLEYLKGRDATVGTYVRQLLARVESQDLKIEAMGRELQQKDARIDHLETENATLKAKVALLQVQVDRVDPTKP